MKKAISLLENYLLGKVGLIAILFTIVKYETNTLTTDTFIQSAKNIRPRYGLQNQVFFMVSVSFINVTSSLWDSQQGWWHKLLLNTIKSSTRRNPHKALWMPYKSRPFIRHASRFIDNSIRPNAILRDSSSWIPLLYVLQLFRDALYCMSSLTILSNCVTQSCSRFHI